MANDHHIIAISQLRRLSSAAVHQWIFATEHPGKMCCTYTHYHQEYCTWSCPYFMFFPKSCLCAKGCIMPCNTWWLQSAHVDMQNFSTQSLWQGRWVTIQHHGQIPSRGGGLMTELCVLSSRKIMYIASIATSSHELFEKVPVWGGWFASSCTKIFPNFWGVLIKIMVYTIKINIFTEENLALKSELDKFLWPVLSNTAYKLGMQNSSRDS